MQVNLLGYTSAYSNLWVTKERVMTNTHDESAAAIRKHLVTKPKTAIGEASFEERVDTLRNIIQKIENIPKNADKILFFRRELRHLESKLSQNTKF
jgi:hypothetical protein